MAIIVQKYGGTSVSDEKKIKKIVAHIKTYREQEEMVVVVVSAMGKETDRIIAEINKVNKNPPLREYDQTLATGEIYTAGLMACALEGIGVKAKSYTAAQIGLITSSNHGEARIKRLKDKDLLLKMIKGHVVVMAGFQGLAEGTLDITTLGRGGSDTSAVAIAASINADRCEIYTDVDGIYAIDPRIVKNARRFDHIGYDQMLNMAAAGAGVLADRCVKLAQEHNVAIKVMLSPSLGKSDNGTLVAAAGKISNLEDVIYLAGIAVNKELGIINITNIPNKPQEAEQIFEKLKEINIINVAQGEGGTTAAISILLADKDIKNAVKHLSIMPDIQITPNKGLVALTLFDPMMKETSGYCWRICRVLGQNNINIEMISSAQNAIEVVIKKDGFEAAANALAQEFNLTV